jgi:hypothetical protein
MGGEQPRFEDLDAIEYRYKPDAYQRRGATPAGAPGERVLGTSTQSMKRAGLGDAVIDDVDGRQAIDMGKAVSATLANQAALARRLEQVEQRKGGEQYSDARAAQAGADAAMARRRQREEQARARYGSTLGQGSVLLGAPGSYPR